jgi:hypothetical protein
MIVRKANLVKRFYRSDGWTRQGVADLIVRWRDYPPIFFVIPRYFDSNNDKLVKKMCFKDSNILPDDYPYSDADYYAVYQDLPLDLSDHEIHSHIGVFQ